MNQYLSDLHGQIVQMSAYLWALALMTFTTGSKLNKHSVPELKKNYSNNEDPWADMLWCTICSKAEFTLKAETLIYTKGMIIKFQTCQRVIFSVYESVYSFPHSVVPTFASIPCPKCCRRGRIENGQRPSWSLPMAHRVCVYVNVYTARFLTDSYLYINRTQ